MIQLHSNGFLRLQEIEKESVLILTMPCEFRIEGNILESLLNNIKSTEENGGVLFLKPTRIDNDRVFIIDKVGYIRNAIEDNPRKDGMKRSNSYLPDPYQHYNTILNVLEDNSLPIEFKILPTQSLKNFESIGYSEFQKTINNQNKSANEIPLICGYQKMFLPRCLIFGNTNSLSDIFIGFYNGFIIPVNFSTLKNLIFDNINNKITDFSESKNLTIMSAIK